MPFTRARFDGMSPTIAAEASAAWNLDEPPDVIEIAYPSESAAKDRLPAVREDLIRAGYESNDARHVGNVWISRWVWQPTEFAAITSSSVDYETAAAVLDAAGIPFVWEIDMVWRLLTSPRLFHPAQDALRADPRTRGAAQPRRHQ